MKNLETERSTYRCIWCLQRVTDTEKPMKLAGVFPTCSEECQEAQTEKLRREKYYEGLLAKGVYQRITSEGVRG